MTKKDLESYKGKKAELQILTDAINEMQKERQAYDLVTGSDVEHPYSAHHIIIWGVPLNDKEYWDMMQEYKKKRKELIEQMNAIEEFIQSIEDEEMRAIARLHYIQDVSYWKMPERFGRTGDGSTEFKKLSRYLRQFITFQ